MPRAHTVGWRRSAESVRATAMLSTTLFLDLVDFSVAWEAYTATELIFDPHSDLKSPDDKAFGADTANRSLCEAKYQHAKRRNFATSTVWTFF